jgi:hypothetical protein
MSHDMNPRDDEPIDREEYEKWEKEQAERRLSGCTCGPDYQDRKCKRHFPDSEPMDFTRGYLRTL